MERVWAEYPGGPRIDPRVLDAVAAADVIITAPGSIYSSLVPILQAEEIVKAVSRHFGVSKSDILSERRHRSVVWPRQIGMYLAKQLTSRSLPEIGRRFGGRDHTTVLHAIKKIEGQLPGNPRLKDEIEALKKLLGY